jgi:hypothetical protein
MIEPQGSVGACAPATFSRPGIWLKKVIDGNSLACLDLPIVKPLIRQIWPNFVANLR